MTLRLLKVFIAVCEYKTMRCAAEKLHITQPTVSQAIADLEKYYNVKLFERLSKKLYITDAGKDLLNYARHIITLTEEMEAHMLNSEQLYPIKIGATLTVGTCVLPHLINLYEAKYPHTLTSSCIENTALIEQMILSSHLDLGLVEGEIKSLDIVKTPIMKDSLVLLCSKDHPFARYDTLPIRSLQSAPFAMREKGSGTRALFEKALTDANISIYEKWTSHTSKAIIEAVIKTPCLAVISERLVEDELKSNKLHKIQLEDVSLTRTFDLIYHKNKYLSEHLLGFIDICKNGIHF